MKRTNILLAVFAVVAFAIYGCDQDKNPAALEISETSQFAPILTRPPITNHPEVDKALAEQKASSDKYRIAGLAEIYVPDDYPTIQAAVGAANPGDRIVVKHTGSPYNGNVIIGKKGIQLIAEGHVKLNGGIWVQADNVKVHGFNIDASSSTLGSAIRVHFAKGVKVSNNKVTGGPYGILLYYSSECRVEKNAATGLQFYGIFLHESNNSSIRQNKSIKNRSGVALNISDNNQVLENEISSNSVYGLVFSDSHNNKAAHNICNRNGMLASGIRLSEWSSNNTIGPGNRANFNTSDGILLFSNISKNVVIKNDFHCNGRNDVNDLGSDTQFIDNSTGPLPECE